MDTKLRILLCFVIFLRASSSESCASTPDDATLLQNSMNIARPMELDQPSSMLQWKSTNAASTATISHSSSSSLSQGHKLYCPMGPKDMNRESGHVKFENGGWTMLGISRVSSKTSWNLIGGYIEFDMDTTKTAPGVNTNLYTSSMKGANCGMACYCDVQKGNHTSCMELDIIEANGHCEMQSTVHTFATDGVYNNSDCDRIGCETHAALLGAKFHIKGAFGLDGSMTVFLDGKQLESLHPVPSAASNKILVDTMNTIGAAIESSQWVGWVPAALTCPSYQSLSEVDNSRITISNVRVFGTTKQGPDATECGATPPPTPAPAPSPPCCSWSGFRCDPTSDYCKANQHQCESDCHGKWTDPATFPAPPTGCCSWYRNECGETSAWCKASKENCEGGCNGRWVQV